MFSHTGPCPRKVGAALSALSLESLGIIKKTIALNSLFEFKNYFSAWYVHISPRQFELSCCKLLA